MRRPGDPAHARQPAGFSIDLCTQVAGGIRHSLKLPALKVAWVPVTPADRVAKLVSGAIDLECGSTTITLGRMEQVAFSHISPSMAEACWRPRAPASRR